MYNSIGYHWFSIVTYTDFCYTMQSMHWWFYAEKNASYCNHLCTPYLLFAECTLCSPCSLEYILLNYLYSSFSPPWWSRTQRRRQLLSYLFQYWISSSSITWHVLDKSFAYVLILCLCIFFLRTSLLDFCSFVLIS